MSKLSASVRLAIKEDSIRYLTDTKRWSLRSLASMNVNLSNQTPAFTSPAASGTRTSPLEDSLNPTSQVAEILLRQVQLRLANQHQKCLDMMNQVYSPSSPSQSLNSSIDNNCSNSKNKSSNKDLTGKKIVVKAVNHPVKFSNMKEWIERSKIVEKERKDSLNGLKNLEVLHADTYSLIHHLLSNGKPTLTRFSPADKSLIAATFEQIRSRHAATVENLADIVIGLRRVQQMTALPSVASSSSNSNKNNSKRNSHPNDNCYDDGDLNANLVRNFLTDRLGIQLLCDHYIGLNKGKPGGGISIQCNFYDVLTDAVLEAKHVCDANVGTAPEVHIIKSNTYDDVVDTNIHMTSRQTLLGSNGEDSHNIINITLIRPWVHHALVEILKNAMSSSVQRAPESPPDIFIRVALCEKMDIDDCSHQIKTNSHNEQPQFVVCEIIDQGIGLNDEGGMAKAFQFAWSSSIQRWDRLDEQQSYAAVRAPLGSLGVGLPLSQMMMQMFGGDVHLTHRRRGSVVLKGGPERDTIEIDSGCTAKLILSMDDTLLEKRSSLTSFKDESDVESLRSSSTKMACIAQ